MYSVERFEKEICISEYMDKYVNVEEFLEYCKECPNYGRLWSCPPYDFDPLEIWGKYETLYVTARKIIFDEDKAPEDKDAMMSVLSEVKDHMSQELFEMERKFPGSISLSAGSCGLCRKAGCTRVCGEPCRYPDKMRYSIESLGGNVGLTVSKLMGIELEWMEEGKMPSYFVLAGGLLKQADRSKEGGSND